MLCAELPEGAIVYEDEDILVVDKPAGVPSQAADPLHDDDLPSRVRRYLAARNGVAFDDVYLGTHQRLDRDTSGLVLYTLRREANAGIAAQFEQRKVGKTYLACVTGLPRLSGERTLRDELLRGRDGRMQVVQQASRSSKAAVTRVRCVKTVRERALVSLGCDTGRTHQLRVQLAHLGAPIAGDAWYAGAPALRLMLHASELRIAHPLDGRELVFHAATPYELTRYLEQGAEPASADPALLRRALDLAVHARYRLLRLHDAPEPTTALRLFNHAGDGDEGLAVDLYGEHLVAHLYNDAIVSREPSVIDALSALAARHGCAGIYVKRHPVQKSNIVDPRDERFAPPTPVWGAAAPSPLIVHEHGMPLEVSLSEGLRTGVFLDQRDNRARVRAMSRDLRVLNLFAYTGGFSVAALLGGASAAVCVDVSAAALAWAQRNVARIDASDRHRALRSDVFEAIDRLARAKELFGVIVLDPPSFSTTRGGRLEVKRDYAKLVSAALSVLEPDGRVLACINHYGLGQGWLIEQLQHGARTAGRRVAQITPFDPPADFRVEGVRDAPSKSALMICA